MSREIKFKLKIKGQPDEVVKTLDEIINSVFMHEVERKRQFTGLRDANGVEIYEFDLLQDSMGKIAVVTWFKSNAEFELLDAEEAIFNGLDCEEPPYQIDVSGGWVKLKVIGNAFEHPHLLDGSK